MTQPISLSAKTLGALAQPNFCPRCFWIQRNVKLPYQIFPSIFSSIDSYTKKVVHGYFDAQGQGPDWLNVLGAFTTYYTGSLHHTKFNRLDPRTNVQLTGVPDDVLILSNGSCVIVDYKTAKYTPGQDELFPIYETQLNGYAWIAEACNLPPVSALALIYLEPRTDADRTHQSRNQRPAGFALEFSAKIVPVNLQPKRLPALFRTARDILSTPTAPSGRPQCAECARVEQMLKAVNGK